MVIRGSICQNLIDWQQRKRHRIIVLARKPHDLVLCASTCESELLDHEDCLVLRSRPGGRFCLSRTAVLGLNRKSRTVQTIFEFRETEAHIAITPRMD
jgi:hypothetical protein